MNTSIPLMAISFASTANIATNHLLYKYHSSSSSSSMLSFNLSRNHKLQLFNKGSSSHSRMSLPIVKAEPNEVSLIEWSLLGDLFSILLCYFWDKVLGQAFASKVVSVVDNNNNDSSATKTKSEVATTLSTVEVNKPLISSEQQPSSEDATEEESMSQFITQVASLVKLVDSRDIVELQLKHFDCEVTISKKRGYTSSSTSSF